MTRPWLLAATCTTLFACNAHAPGKAGAGQADPDATAPLLQLPKDLRPTRYALFLEVIPEHERFNGAVDISVELDRPRTILWLHGKGLHVTAASVGMAKTAPQEARYSQVNDDGLARLDLPQPIGPGAATLHLAWDAAYEPKLVGLYLAHEAGLNYAFTMFEPVDARRTFPCFDEPAFKTPFELTLTIPAADTAISNTNSIKEEALPEGLKRVQFGPTAPLPTYLVALGVGPFDVVSPPPLPPNEVRSRPLQIRGIAAKGRGKELSFALQAGGELLVILERYFGIPFPYEKLDHLAVPDFAYGAEENVGAIIYREEALLFEEGRSAENLKSRIGGIMAHEMAHQWFGDLVTMRWWDDTWLNESFATWMGHRAEQEWRPAYGASEELLKSVQGAMGNDSLVSARAVRQPLERMQDVWNQFDGITYQKGGGTLAMFERYLGAEPFRKGVAGYLKAHANGSGSTDDLLNSFSKASGKDVVAPFHSFLDQAGVPLIQARLACDTAAGGAVSKPRLMLEQSRYFPLGSPATAEDRKRTWQIPVCVRYQSGASEREACTLLTSAQGTIPLDGCPAWVMPNADAAGYYRWSLAPDDLKKLTQTGYSKLTLRERISLASSISSSLASNTLPEADALAALEPIARDPDGTVAVEPMEVLGRAHGYLVDEALRPAVAAYAAALYAPALQKLGWEVRPEEPFAVQRFRRLLLGFLALGMDDAAVRKEAARRGRAYAALSGSAFDQKAVVPDLAGLALAVAVQEGDSQFFDGLIGRLAQTDDAAVRRRILTALASTRDPKLADRALALALDPHLRTNERTTPLSTLAGDRRTREQALTWLEANFDLLLPRIPESDAQYLPFVNAGFCDQPHLERAQQFFGPRAEKIPAMPRSLAQALEATRLCIAQSAAQRPGAAAFFARGALRK